MARFNITSKDGQSVRFEGKPRYIGSYLKPSYIEFSEIASPTPIEWEVGDYVDYPRTGLRYKLYSIPQASKNAKKGAHGRSFTYSNVQLHAATKELEIALFRDLVDNDNNIHFSTSPDVATFEDVYGIARRIQACMNDLYPNRWVIRVADFDSVADAEILEKISEAKDFALSGGTCLDALSKIYELWQDIGWIHSYEDGKDVITIGYANKRISANTTDSFIYGKGNGLTAIKKNQTNKDEFATRLYVYGSERNLPSRYYNNLNIRNAESVDIRNLMLPLDKWGKTGGVADAKLAYLENASAVAKYGVVPRVHYFDSDDAGADIYPSLTGITIGQVRSLLQSQGNTTYYPSSVYSDSERVDEINTAVYIPSDNGELKRGGQEYQISKDVKISVSPVTENIPKNAGRFEILTEKVIYQSLEKADFHYGEVIFKPSMLCLVPDAGFKSVNASVTLGDVVDSYNDPNLSNKSTNIAAVYDSYTGNWIISFKDMSVRYDKVVYDGGFPINFFISIAVEKDATEEEKEITIEFSGNSAFLGIKEILEKTFILRLKQIGFDISERASLGEGKSISMKSGMCEGRTFVISSCEYVPHLDSWDLTLKRQQDDTLGMLFPNQNYKIWSGDKFVLLDIAMPELYIHAAMDRLLSEGEKLLTRASKIQNHYEPSVDAKVMVESGRTLREGMFMQIEDEDVVDNKIDYILIDTISIHEDESAIPTYKVTLKERRKVSYKGTPSATSSTQTSSVSDEEVSVDLSDYVKRSEIDAISVWKLDKEKDEIYAEKKVLVKNDLVINGNIASGGKGENTKAEGTVTSIVIDGNSYIPDSAGIIDLTEAFNNQMEPIDLSDYYTKSQTNSLLSIYLKSSDADLLYAKAIDFELFKTRKIIAGQGLNGGGDLSNDVTIDIVSANDGIVISEDSIRLNVVTDLLTNNSTRALAASQGYALNNRLHAIERWGQYISYNSANDAIEISANLIVTKDLASGGVGQGTPSSGTVSGVKVGTAEYKEVSAGLLNLTDLFDDYATSSELAALSRKVDALSGGGSIDVSVSQILTDGIAIGSITVDGKPTTLYAPEITAYDIFGSSSIGSTTSFIYWNGSQFKTKGLGSYAFVNQIDYTDVGVTKDVITELIGDTTYAPYLASGYLPKTGGTITGDLRLKGSGDYGNTLYFGDGDFCYIAELSDDVLTIYGKDGINLTTYEGYVRINDERVLIESDLEGLFDNDIAVGGNITPSKDETYNLGSYAYQWNMVYAVNGIFSGEQSSGSDVRFKDVIGRWKLDVNDMANAPLFTFKWNDRNDNSVHLGSSAQYWEKIAPWLVTGSDFKTLNYSVLGVAMGISLAEKTVNHEERIKALERENEKLKEELRRVSHDR